MVRPTPACAVLAMLAASLGAPAPAAAQNPWDQSHGVLVAPEGTVAYAASRATLLVLRRDPATGALEFEDGPGTRAEGGRTYELAPDASAIYTGGDSRIVAHLRNADGTLRAGPILPIDRGAHDLALTHDGRTLLVSEDTFFGESARIHAIARDPASNALTSVGHVPLPPPPREGAWQEAYGLAVSADDRFLYVGDSETVHVFALGGGLPSHVQSVDPQCSCYTESLALSPDGTRLYTGPMNLAAFAVDRDSGRLTTVSGAELGVDSGWRDETHRDLIVSPDSKAIWMSERRSDVIHQAAATGDGATHVRDYHNYADAPGLDNPSVLTISPDGRFLYASAGGDQPGARPSRIIVFRRDPETNALAFASLFDGPVLYPQRPASLGQCTIGCGNGTGVTTVAINGGEEYTNDRRVVLTIDPGFDVEGFYVDNDGGMKHAKHLPAGADERYAWTLESTGPEILPKTVYVLPNGHGPIRVATDDIILDETRPSIVSARGDRRLRVLAVDHTSGVGRLQLARSRARPLRWRRARARTVVALPRRVAWVRVADRAGNRSRWRRIERAR